MIGIDTNLLVYAFQPAVAEHQPARRAIERASRHPRGWGFALGSVAEFWSVVTHPAVRDGPSTPEQARGFLEGLVSDGASVWIPVEGFLDRLLRIAESLGIRGQRVFDLQIALTAFDNGATEIWTHDSQFTALPGIRIHDPL